MLVILPQLNKSPVLNFEEHHTFQFSCLIVAVRASVTRQFKNSFNVGQVLF